MNTNAKIEKLEKFILTMGLNDKDTKAQIISDKDARELLESLIIENGFDGATILEGLGIYKHEAENNIAPIVKEKCLRIELLFTSFQKVVKFAQVLKSRFNQESIALERQFNESALV